MNEKILNSTAWYFIGTFISAILGFISAPMLTRILSTEVYAQYGMVATFTTLIATFIYLGQDEAFMRYFTRRKESYWSFFWKCIRLPLVLCLIILFLLLEPNNTIIGWVFSNNTSKAISMLLGLYIMMLVLQRFFMLTARMEERAANYSISNIITKIIFIAGVCFFYYIGQTIDLFKLIIALIIGVLCALIINLTVIMKTKHDGNTDCDNVTSKELITFGIPFVVSSTMFWAVPLLEKIMIRDLTDWTVLAIYTSANMFVTAMGLIKTTVSNIWIPYVYKSYTDEESFKKVFRVIGSSLSWLCIVILAGVIFFRRWIVCIFASAYYDSMLIAPALVCGACFDLLTCIYSIGINVRKKTQFHILIPCIQIVLALLILNFYLPQLGLIATGIAYLLSIAISRIVQMTIGLHYYGTGGGYCKLFSMLGIYIIVGLLSCFFSNIQFDILCGISLLVLGTFITWNDLRIALKYLFYNKQYLVHESDFN